jgi:hypothetical protein
VPVLGAYCISEHAFLTLVDRGEVREFQPERLEFRAGLSGGEQLDVFAADVGRALRAADPSLVCILQAVSRYTDTHTGWTQRIAMETLIRLSAAQAGFPCRYVSQQAVPGALGLEGRGGLAVLGRGYLSTVGKYWSQGRLLAGLAAAAEEKKADAAR